MNTATAVHISSNALMLIGHQPITSFEEAGAGARVANAFYDTSYKALLSLHPWTFATKKASLNQLSQKPLNEWQYMYQIPTDSIKILNVYPHSDYAIYEDKIYSNNSSLDLDYLYRVDESYLPTEFRETLELYLAAKWAIPVTENATTAGQYLQMYEIQLRKAKYIDSQSKPNKAVPDVAAAPIRLRRRRGW